MKDFQAAYKKLTNALIQKENEKGERDTSRSKLLITEKGFNDYKKN